MSLKLVELHVHLDGAIKHETLHELSRIKGRDIGESVEHLRKRLVHESPCANLWQFLDPFVHFMPLIVGDPDAIERIAYELCEVQAKNNVVYFEARYCPHLLANTEQHLLWNPSEAYAGKGHVTPEEVVLLVKKGFDRGRKDFGVEARQILAVFRGKNQMFDGVLDMCQSFASDGVVGLDIAGLAGHEGNEEADDHNVKLFQDAKRLNIHRTVHAGEAGTANDVKEAIDLLQAERIGHGYHVLDDASIYNYAREKGVHFEVCPWSSYLTGSVTRPWSQHPAVTFMADGVNFGLNTDDPTLTGNWMQDEISMVQKHLGWSDEQIRRLQLNALSAAFCGEDEKIALKKKLLA